MMMRSRRGVCAIRPPRALSYAVAPRSNLLHPELIDVDELIVVKANKSKLYMYNLSHPSSRYYLPVPDIHFLPPSAATSFRVGSKAPRSLYAAALSRGLQRYLGAVFFFLLAMSCPRPRSVTASWSSDGARNCSALAATVVRNS